MNAYRIAANAVFWLHQTLIILLFVGFFAQFVFLWYGPIEAVALTLTIVSQGRQKKCPLTVLENYFRAKCEPRKTYEGSFLRYYTKKHFKVNIPLGVIPKILKLMLAISVIVLISTLRF